MTKDELISATEMTSELAERWYYPLMATMEACGIDTPLRQSHFLAQTGAESAGFRIIKESLNYSVDGLKIFGPRLSIEQRERYGRKPGEPALSSERQAEIARLVYGGRYGNNYQDDGWKYRGRGLKQITFRNNYIACSEALGLDLEKNPDLLLTELNAAFSAGWFWQANNCNSFADNDDILNLSRRINGGFNGLNERTRRTIKAKETLLSLIRNG